MQVPAIPSVQGPLPVKVTRDGYLKVQYGVWRLWADPQEKQLICTAAGSRAEGDALLVLAEKLQGFLAQRWRTNGVAAVHMPVMHTDNHWESERWFAVYFDSSEATVAALRDIVAGIDALRFVVDWDL